MKCVVCNRELKGSQKKYCGHSCSGYVKQENEKRRVIRNLLPPRPCAVCGGVFQPVRRANIVCSRECGIIRNVAMKKAAAAAKISARPKPVLKIMRHTKPHFNQNCNSNKKEILRFIKKGGQITKLPSAPSGKSPEINMNYGWIPDELFGSALMYEIDDENG